MSKKLLNDCVFCTEALRGQLDTQPNWKCPTHGTVVAEGTWRSHLRTMRFPDWERIAQLESAVLKNWRQGDATEYCAFCGATDYDGPIVHNIDCVVLTLAVMQQGTEEAR